MKSVTNKDIQTLFLFKNSKYTTESKYNIILSPEFYWCRVFDIPVNSNNQIKKILPTLFEDILPHNNFEYKAIRLKDKKYICFAYESSEIIDNIKSAGLNITKLTNIYFAQTELVQYAPFKIDELAYISKNDCLIQIPSKFVKDDTPNLNFENIKLSNHKIKLNIHKNIINQKNIFILSSFLLILTCINTISIFSLNSEFSNFDENKEKLIQKYNLPRTSIQLNSIIKSYKNIDIEQNKIREALNDIFNIHKKHQKIKVKNIHYTNNLILEIENISFDELKKYLTKYTIKKIQTQNKVLKVEISI